MTIDMPTLQRIMIDVAGDHPPDDNYTDGMRVIYDRMKSGLAHARKADPKLFLHIPGDGQEGMPDASYFDGGGNGDGGGGGGGREDFDDSEPRDESGKWTGGGGGSSGAAPEAWTKSNPAGNAHTFSTAQEYLKHAGLPGLKVLSQQTLTPEEGRAIASSYDAAVSDPKNADTQAAYKAFNAELASQRTVAENAGYKFEPWSKEGQPYANSKEMMKDVRDNKHLYYFKSTEGTTPNNLMSLEENDTFRAVHDLFGHAMGGNQFGPKGETNAFLDHVQMFSPLARKALATETVGQNAWFNFSKSNEGKGIKERKFADQKAFLLDPKLYQPLIDRALTQAPAGAHDDAADDDCHYHACPGHRGVAVRMDFDDSEPRAEDGKWTGGGDGPMARHVAKLEAAKAAKKASKTPKPGMSKEQFTSLTSRMHDEGEAHRSAVKTFTAKLTDQEHDVCRNYSAFAVAVNQSLRQGRPPSSPVEKQALSVLDSAIAKGKAASDLVVYRGIHSDLDPLSQLKPGTVIKDRGYVSTSSSQAIAKEFAGVGEAVGHADPRRGGPHILVSIHIPKGHTVAPIPSDYSYEHEYVLPRDSQFKIKSVSQKDGQTIVDAEVL